MQFKINKAKTAAMITTVLLMASVTLMALPVKAQEGAHGGQPEITPWGPLPAGVTPDVTVITYAYLAVTANPIGVGQTGLVNIWTTPSGTNNLYASNYKVTLTRPDNTTDTVTMNSYYADRTSWFEYVFDQVGTWKLKMDYPGDYYPAGTYGRGGMGRQDVNPTNVTVSRWYMPSSTPVVELVVQQEMVPSWPPAALPTHEYWTRPVSIMNREWWSLLGNYPYSGSGEGWPDWPANTNYFSGTQASSYRYQPMVIGPNTCHIVWKRQDTISGLIGNTAGIDSLASTASVPGLIYAGRCYQTRTTYMPNGSWLSCATCYDLRTGQLYYAVPTGLATNPGVTPTLISYVKSTAAEVPGEEAGLGWTVSLIAFSGTNMYKIDPWTGLVTSNVSTLGAGRFIDPFMINIQTNNTATGPRWINWTTAGTSTNFTSRVMDNRTYNSISIGTACDWQAGVWGTISSINPAPNAPTGCRIIGYDLWTGQVICNFTDTYVPYQTGTIGVDHGKLACLMQDGYVVAYDLRTGKRAWVSQQTYSVGGYPWGIWGSYSSASYGGNYMVFLTDGIYAFNWDTGKISWVYRSPSYAFEGPYSGWTDFDTFTAGCLIADGKMYATNAEHTPSQPFNRAYKLHCINVTTGEGIWNISTPTLWSGGTSFTCADSYLTVGAYTGYMYVLGRGKSATTVTGPETTVPLGTAVLIKGTVLDQSPAQPGAACVADVSQATYMEYLHLQQPIDGIWHNVTIFGVPVMLTAVGSDGTVTDIGTTTSDVSGTFGTAWTPPKEDTYKIIATFAGSESYGSSWAETHVSVGPAPASPTPTPTQPAAQPAPDYTGMIIGSAIAIIIAVAIVGIMLYRKRP